MFYRFGDCELDLARGELRREGEVIPLQPKPLALLATLIEERHRVVPKEELLERKAVGLCTPKQAKQLVAHGVDPREMYYDEAKELLRELKARAR